MGTLGLFMRCFENQKNSEYRQPYPSKRFLEARPEHYRLWWDHTSRTHREDFNPEIWNRMKGWWRDESPSDCIRGKTEKLIDWVYCQNSQAPFTLLFTVLFSCSCHTDTQRATWTTVAMETMDQILDCLWFVDFPSCVCLICCMTYEVRGSEDRLHPPVFFVFFSHFKCLFRWHSLFSWKQ